MLITYDLISNFCEFSRENANELSPGVKQIFEKSLVYSDSLVSFQGACFVWHGHNTTSPVRVADRGNLSKVCADIVVTVHDDGG